LQKENKNSFAEKMPLKTVREFYIVLLHYEIFVYLESVNYIK